MDRRPYAPAKSSLSDPEPFSRRRAKKIRADEHFIKVCPDASYLTDFEALKSSCQSCKLKGESKRDAVGRLADVAVESSVDSN